jgi:hypothetical protein
MMQVVVIMRNKEHWSFHGNAIIRPTIILPRNGDDRNKLIGQCSQIILSSSLSPSLSTGCSQNLFSSYRVPAFLLSYTPISQSFFWWVVEAAKYGR